MHINQRLIKEGAFLFRWRSYIPLLLIFPGLVAIADSAIIEQRYGDLFEEIFVFIGFIISLSGLAIRWFTVGFVPSGTSGRNTKDQRANCLNTKGMYSIVKNPLYLGNYIAIIGVLVSIKIWWFVLIGSLAYWLYIERIIATEEKFLIDKYGKKYSEWACKTPIFIPNFKLWSKPEMVFSLKTVLRREYNGFMAICVAFFSTEMILDVFIKHDNFFDWLVEDWQWLAILIFGSIVFITLRTLKRHTTFLCVVGR